MFTGIIEEQGRIKSISTGGSSLHFEIESKISPELKVDQSVSHDGVCLTVTKVEGNVHTVTAVEETLKRSTLGKKKPGMKINLERSMPANGRFDGHIVQGHVDQMGECTSIEEREGSWLMEFSYNPGLENITVNKGSICVNGVSLTCFNSRDGAFTVTIIPYTMEHTNLGALKIGDKVNLEFDIIGKYLQKLTEKMQV